VSTIPIVWLLLIADAFLGDGEVNECFVEPFQCCIYLGFETAGLEINHSLILRQSASCATLLLKGIRTDQVVKYLDNGSRHDLGR
jgi:hypothetical protein